MEILTSFYTQPINRISSRYIIYEYFGVCVMQENRLVWVDCLKFLAIIGVIGIHVSSSLLSEDILFSLNWFQGVFVGSLFRFAIILFVMASGYLLLRKQQSIYVIPFRIKRILLPFIFWLIVYSLIKVFVIGELGTSWNFFDLIEYIFMGFLNPTNISIQFWYVYMILGLYIFSPILSRWIQNAPIKEIEYLILIWILISIFQFFDMDSILLDYLRYFTGAIGYFVLGYYLTIKKNRLLHDRKLGVILFISGTLITILGTVGLSYMLADQSLFFIQLGDITPGACLQGIGLFIIVFNSDFNKLDRIITDLIVKISISSYGIYLVNILVINLLEKYGIINFNGFALLNIGLSIILVLIISYAIIELMSRFKILRHFTGR